MMRTRTLMAGSLVTLAALSACGNPAGTRARTSPSASTQVATTTISGNAAGLPTKDSVRDGRFVNAVQLDEGVLRVDPAPPGMTPSVSQASATSEIWASPAVSGVRSGMVLGFGLVTTLRGVSNVALLTAAPAWIGFAWGGVYHCPFESPGMRTYPRPPGSGYVAIVVGADGTPPDLTYTARSSICRGPPTGPSIATATQVVSVPWHQVGPLSATGRLTIRYALPGCGRPFGIEAVGDRTSTTLSVNAIAPDEALPCPAPMSKTETVDLSPPGSTLSPGPLILHHGALGLVRQIQSI